MKARMSETHQCFCGGFVRLETSWTKDNPGRRLWTCCRKRGCGYFDWFDPQMSAWSKMIIPGLLKRIDKANDELKSLRRREKLLWFLIVIGILVAVLSANATQHNGSSGTKTVLNLLDGFNCFLCTAGFCKTINWL
ncbi:unnamed protein product [Prunus armeniaca]|uniref:GRF-type domain-containing protein n=1 Tax=Prunus armeniaca TaxID=36596 RepID=A0A6J5XVQ0_PRUAR|nr:unnamed protein product [Prunus armeniaca]